MKRNNSAIMDGDCICFIGDSITHAGSFHSEIYLFHVTRFPGISLKIWNCGRAGGVTNQAVERFDREILPLKPTVSALMFGMNDCGRHRYGLTKESPEDLASRNAHFEEYRLRTSILIDRLQKENSRIILQTPTPYDQTAAEKPGFPQDGAAAPGHEHANDALSRFSDWLRTKALDEGAVIVDYHTPMTAMTLSRQQDDPSFSITGDRVHPEPSWHIMMAYEFLTQTGTSPDVASLHLDISRMQCEHDGGSKVKEVSRHSAGFSFTWQAASLPFPAAPVYDPVISLIPFHEKLNMEKLSISGLADGNYRLLIDGARICTFTSLELGNGVNLALFKNTPQYALASEIMEMNSLRHELNVRLQDANMIDTWRNPDASDQDVLDAARQAAASNAPGGEWFAKVNRSYIELFGKTRETRLELMDLMDRINKMSRTAPRKYSLERVL